MIGQDFLPSNILSKVFNLKYKDSTGTTFLIDYEGKNYFVTAKHVIAGATDSLLLTVEILKEDQWKNLQVIVHLHPDPQVDIIILEPVNLTHTTSPISLKGIDLIFGDDGFFLGFPFGLRNYDRGNINAGFPFPLVKKATFSGMLVKDGISILFLDGNNNPGFSGGPVFFRERIKEGDNKWHLVGVVSAYVNQKNEIVTPIGNLNYTENSGIIIAYGKNHILEVINNLKTP